MPAARKHWLIFSDMDGSLLDHHTYSHAAADATLAQCHRLSIPIVCCTSKTRAELLELRRELNNVDPFIIENGAAIFIPKGYFSQQPEDTHELDEFWVKTFSQSRQHWLNLLEQAPQHLRAALLNFSLMGDSGIAEATGLPAARAMLANRREYTEPALWQGDSSDQAELIEWLTEAGARVQQGGRFLHITDQCDKGIALQWLKACYQIEQANQQLYSLAIGDSDNDIAMLEAADFSLVIRSPVRPFPTLLRTTNTYFSKNLGPAGWAEGVSFFIPACQQQTHNNT